MAKVRIEEVQGHSSNTALYIGDLRVTGRHTKPLGGGHVVNGWNVELKSLKEAVRLAEKEALAEKRAGFTDYQKRCIRRDLDKLDGKREFNSPSNICWGDGLFAKSLEEKYGESITELRRIVRNVRARPKRKAKK